ncbi:MAG: hypothetical protein RQ856_05040 [Candidatus Izemoplasmatales bacterium]|nr:hypothetical protein [Candidatus Izemoplasmatales bacterium]
MNELQLLATYLTDKLNLIITSLNGKVTEAESLAAVRNGVATDGDDLNKLRNLIAGLAAIQLTLDDVLGNGNDANGAGILLLGPANSLTTQPGLIGTTNVVLQANGVLIFKSQNNAFAFEKFDGNTLSFFLGNLTQSRQLTFQNKSITVAGLDDISQAIADLVDSSPAALDTLNELAAALGNDPNFAATVTNSIATKLPLTGGTMSGNIELGSNFLTSAGILSMISQLAALSVADGTGKEMRFDFSGLTALRVQTIQNKDGTVAHLDDIKNKQIIETSDALYQVLETDHTIVLLPGASIVEMMNINVTPPVNLIGQEFTIKNLSNSVCTIQNQHTQTFDGNPNITINHGESYTIMATPSFNWIII